jgi:hypothetical protein
VDAKDFVDNWTDEHGKIDEDRIGDTYMTYDHEEWDATLSVPVSEVDQLYEKIRNFIQNQNE